MNFKLMFCLAVAWSLSACASVPQLAALRQLAPSELLAPVALPGVPFFPQDEFQCGPAALATLLVHSGVATSPAQLVPLVYLPARQGSFQLELLAATRSHGRVAYRIAPTLMALFREVSAGHPVLVLQNLGLAWYPRWHFAVVKGFDLEERKVLLNSGIYENYTIPLATFERTWARAEYWGMLALEPGAMPANGDAAEYFSAVAALEETNPAAAIDLAYASGLATWPHDRDLLMGYGNRLYANGQVDAAVDRFTRVTGLYPAFAPAWNNLAQLLFERGDVEQARLHANRALALGGTFADTYRATVLMIGTAAEDGLSSAVSAPGQTPGRASP